MVGERNILVHSMKIFSRAINASVIKSCIQQVISDNFSLQLKFESLQLELTYTITS